MIDATKGYFSNHQLSVNDFQSLQNSPDNFKPHLTLKETIIDFLRKLLFLETKNHALTDLNSKIYEIDFVNSPTKLFDIFDEVLPPDLKKDIEFRFTVVYENYGNKLESVEIFCEDDKVKIDFNNYWLTDLDEKNIERTKFGVIQYNKINEAGDNGTKILEINYFIDDELHKIMEELLTDNGSTCVKLINNTNGYHITPGKVEFIKNGLPFLIMPINLESEMAIRTHCCENSINVISTHNIDQYKEVTDNLMAIDKKLVSLRCGEKINSDKEINEIDEILNKLKNSIQINDIVRSIDTVKASSEKCAYCIHQASDAINMIKYKKEKNLSLDEINYNINKIKDNIKDFKIKIATETCDGSNDAEKEITHAELMIKSAERKIKSWHHKYKLEDDSLKISSMKAFVKYCAEHLDVKAVTPENNTNDIVDLQALSELENKVKINSAFNDLYLFISNEKGYSNSGVSSIRELESLLFAYQGHNILDKENQEIAKFSDVIYDYTASLFIPNDFLQEYNEACKTLAEEIKTSLHLLSHEPEKFSVKAMDFLNQIYAVKLSFINDYTKCFDAGALLENEGMLAMFRSMLHGFENNINPHKDKINRHIENIYLRICEAIDRRIQINEDNCQL